MMKTCAKCGYVTNDPQASFCPRCAAPLPEQEDTTYSQDAAKTGDDKPRSERMAQAVRDVAETVGSWVERVKRSAEASKDYASDLDADDVWDNRVMAVLAYLGPLCLVPVFAAENSRFARFHANQGLVLFLVELITGFLFWTLTVVLAGVSVVFVALLGVLQLVYIVYVAWAVFGIVNAVSGRAKELPVIGGVRILR